MASVELQGVYKSFGTTEVIHGVDISIADREFVVLVGPSGCGKSTLLRMIAGLEQITAGEIQIAGRVVNFLPPKERGVAMVFQHYALYPHMTVFDNMAFSLKLRRANKSTIEEQVKKAAKILHDLHVVDVVLQEQVVAVYLFDDAPGLRRKVQEVAGHVVGIDRLDQEMDAPLGAGPGRETQVFDIRLLHLRPPGAAGRQARHGVEARATERTGVFEGLADRVLELALASGQDGDSSFARIPVPRRQVEESLGKAVARQPFGQLRRRPGIGEQELHTLESGPCRRLETLEEVCLVEHHR